MDAGRPAEAENFFRTAMSAGPYNRQVIYGLSQCLEKLGKKDEAKQLGDKLTQMQADSKRLDQLTHEAMKKPHDPGLRYEIGMIFMRNGFTDDAVRWLTSALKENPAHQPARAALVEHYERTGNAEAAARHRRFLENTSPQNASGTRGGESP